MSKRQFLHFKSKEPNSLLLVSVKLKAVQKQKKLSESANPSSLFANSVVSPGATLSRIAYSAII